MPAPLVTLQDIRDAASLIRPLARVTPLIEVTDVPGADAPAGPLFLKCENLQRSGAFKIRGAVNMMLRLTDADRGRGVITFSSGNHGIAMSLAARLLGVPAVVVMPTTAPPVKIDGVRRLGAEVVFEGTTTVERRQRAEALAAERGLTIVPPFDHEWIVAGQGTIGLELLEQCPGAATVYVPASGGGMIAGVATAIKTLQPTIRVVAVEPAGAARMTASLHAGHPVTVTTVPGIADGLLAVRPGDVTFRHVQAFVDHVITVEDAEIARAVRWIFDYAKLVVEPSGAATVAAVLGRKSPTWSRPGLAPLADTRAEPSVAVLSGGSVDAAAYAKYISRT